MKKIKYKINKIYNLVFGEKFYKKLDFNWNKNISLFSQTNLISAELALKAQESMIMLRDYLSNILNK